jgi:hypothetical protein
MSRRAACACGNVQVTCEGEPLRVSVCHCLDCQRRTGSAFGVQARFARAQVAMTGEPAIFVRKGDSGNAVTFQFCPRCGSTVTWQLEDAPDMVIVAVGGFADANFPVPTVSVYGERRHSWAEIAGPLEQL